MKWQPIETAPKNKPILMVKKYTTPSAKGTQTPVNAFVGTYCEHAGEMIAHNSIYTSDTNFSFVMRGDDLPTHWCEIPAFTQTNDQ